MNMIGYYLLDRHDKICWNVLVFSGFLYSLEFLDSIVYTLRKTDLFPIVVLLYGIIILLLLGLFIASLFFKGNFSLRHFGCWLLTSFHINLPWVCFIFSGRGSMFSYLQRGLEDSYLPLNSIVRADLLRIFSILVRLHFGVPHQTSVP